MWSGWIAVVDKEKSKTYTNLVSKSETIISDLPWEKKLEKNRFTAPDFSSLDVLTFAGDRLPSGINIPNYYDIRENDGFKNVVFQNKDDDLKKKQTVFNFTIAHAKD
jgi:dipeptidyl-peptidase-3